MLGRDTLGWVGALMGGPSSSSDDEVASVSWGSRYSKTFGGLSDCVPGDFGLLVFFFALDGPSALSFRGLSTEDLDPLGAEFEFDERIEPKEDRCAPSFRVFFGRLVYSGIILQDWRDSVGTKAVSDLRQVNE